MMGTEVSYEEILEKAERGEFHEWNFIPFSFQENGYEDVIDEIKKYTAVDYINLQEKAKKYESEGNSKKAKEYYDKAEKMVDDVLQIYRDTDVFPIQYFSEFGVADEIAKCMSYKAKFDGNTVSCGAGVGTTLCNFLFPNIFDTPSAHDLNKKNARSLYEKFYNDEYLRRAIKFCFSYKNGCPVPTSVMGGMRLVGSAPTNFRPMNAKAVYERFCPENGVIYDYCCVDNETEFFDGERWKSIEEYREGDKVLQYEHNGTARLVRPIEYIHYKNNELFYEYDSYTLSSCQTGNHDVVYIKNGKVLKIKQKDILKNEVFEGIPVSCLVNGKIVMSSKEISSLIDSVELGDGIYPEMTFWTYGSKKMLYNELKERGFILVNSKLSACIYTGKSEDNVKRIGTMLSTMGYSVTYVSDKIAEIYECESVASYNTCLNSFKKVRKQDKYCFVVPSHMLVLRRHGKVYVTGNCGFGGRMLGALSSDKNYTYIGTDPNTETMYHLHQLGQYIEGVTGRENSYELHCCGSEEFIGPENSIDFAFSSPPYFNLEVYSDEPTQCYNKYPELEEWLEGYVRQTIKNIKRMLKGGRYYAVNIADFKVGSDREVAYVDEWIRISTEEGMPLFDIVYLGVTARAGSAEQAAGELKKENILIFKKPL